MTRASAAAPADILRLHGRVVDAHGRALAGLRLAVVDADLLRDDLLAVGFTDDDGLFRLSFTRAEFNQDVFERETVPNLYIVFSNLRDDAYAAVHREDFPKRRFADGREDLGVVRIGSWLEAPVFLGKQSATPGFREGGLRLNVDDDLVVHCLEEIAPLVEQLTGCRDLLADLRFELHGHLGAVAPQSQGNDGMHPVQTWLLGNSAFANLAALYDPDTNVVHINLGWARRQALDGIKVALGHELVHVAQYRSAPELAVMHKRLMREAMTAGGDVADLVRSAHARRVRRFMTNLEGYASYIENDHLRRHYNCAASFAHLTPLQTALLAAGKRFVPDLASSWSAKAAHYADGRAQYQRLATSGALPAFQADLPG